MIKSLKILSISYQELKLPWFSFALWITLLLMQKRTVRPGRPTGTTTYEAEPAMAFGMAVRAARLKQGIAQDEFAVLAGVDRSHLGKIERGEHMPTLVMILRIATALNVRAADLIAATESNLQSGLKE
ncbi:helix-turn-helix domain-containing protein [Pseudomonas aeruginosa]